MVTIALAASAQQANPYIVGILALAGVIIGVLGGVFNQAFAAKRQRRDAVAHALRTERREIYASFLLGDEKVKQLIALSVKQTADATTIGPSELRRAIADLWEVHVQLSLISGEEIRRLAHETLRYRGAQVTAAIEGHEIPRQRPATATRGQLRDAMQDQLGVKRTQVVRDEEPLR